MAQRCSFCGKTEKQHGGKACVDLSLLKRILFKDPKIDLDEEIKNKISWDNKKTIDTL